MCSGMHASAFKLVQQPCRSPLIKGHPLHSYSEMEYAHPPTQSEVYYSACICWSGPIPKPYSLGMRIALWKHTHLLEAVSQIAVLCMFHAI